MLVWPPAEAVSEIVWDPTANVPTETFAPVQLIDPWITPSRFHVHEVASLDHVAEKTVAVVPPAAGFNETEQVGVTVTVLELQLVVPPGPVAVSVSVWLPAASRLEVAPLQATLP